MIDLPIGVKFYFDDTLVGVAEAIKGKNSRCEECFFNKVKEDEYDLCEILECSKYLRKDRTNVSFREVKNDKN